MRAVVVPIDVLQAERQPLELRARVKRPDAGEIGVLERRVPGNRPLGAQEELRTPRRRHRVPHPHVELQRAEAEHRVGREEGDVRVAHLAGDEDGEVPRRYVGH